MIKITNQKITKELALKRALLAFLLAIVAFVVASFVTKKIVIAGGGSVPYYVFLKSNKSPEKGDYVVLKTSENDEFAQGKVMVKRVTCVGGEVLKIVDLDYYCCKTAEDDFNSCVHLGKAKLYSKTGKRVFPFNPCGSNLCVVEIPKGKFFVVNSHVDSYDSRYFGFVSQDGDYKILYTVRPLL